MKVLVTGVRGQLGHDVVSELEKRGIEAVGVSIREMNFEDPANVDRVMKEAAPRVFNSSITRKVPTGRI